MTKVKSNVVAIPMHGEVKMLREGLRTRDAHLLEWMARLRPDMKVDVISRPEPWPRLTLARMKSRPLPSGWHCITPEPIAIPPLRQRQRWWVDSAKYSRPWPADADRIINWNPTAPIFDLPSNASILFDLLDDWSVHATFEPIWPEVKRGYEKWFGIASAVTANSEGTLELAQRFGRSDAVLVLNGCDPERFSTGHCPGSSFTVGYGGKIGHRLDVDLVEECALRLPHVRFEFVGPVLGRSYSKRLKTLSNIVLTGDIHYDLYPGQFERWDVAWVPHSLGRGEVGGDVIKLYEYRAAGLPVVMTKIIGWQRAPAGVCALERDNIPDALEAMASKGPGGILRDKYVTPLEHTWRFKANYLLSRIGLSRSVPSQVEL